MGYRSISRIFHQLMSSNCKIVNLWTYILWEWNCYLSEKLKYIITQKPPRKLPQPKKWLKNLNSWWWWWVLAATISTARLVKATRHHLGVTPGAPPPPPAHRKQPRPQHTGSLFGASYQTYQNFHNKHLNRLSLSALRTNGPPSSAPRPGWVCSYPLSSPSPVSFIDKKCTQCYNITAITSLMSRH